LADVDQDHQRNNCCNEIDLLIVWKPVVQKHKKIAEHRGEDIKHSKFHMGTPFGLMA
jgi:hypothetical protein